MAKILVITKRQYTNRDLIDDRFGRMREIPLNLSLMGHSIEGLCLSYQSRKEGIFTDGQVRWHSINLGRFFAGGISKFLQKAGMLARNCDILWVGSDAFYGQIGWLLAKTFHKPFIFDLYDNFECFFTGMLPGLNQFYRRALNYADAVTCVSVSLSELINTYGRTSDIHVLENAVPENLFIPMNQSECRSRLGLPQKNFLVGTAGDIGFHRGTDTLIDAFRILKIEDPDIHLVLAGRKREPIPKDSRIHYLGQVPPAEVPTILNALDVAVICNRENKFGRYCFPQKAREIMACRVPMVAARVGSMMQLLENFPEWLYEYDDASDLCRVLKNRRDDRRTDYPKIVTWADVALKLNDIIQKKLV